MNPLRRLVVPFGEWKRSWPDRIAAFIPDNVCSNDLWPIMPGSAWVVACTLSLLPLCTIAQDKGLAREQMVMLCDMLSDHVSDKYLKPKVGARIARDLAVYRAELENGASMSRDTFMAQVNRLLFDASEDHHLRFYYDPEKFNIFDRQDRGEIETLEREQYRRVNFGIQKAEILPGNIGYLRLNKFQQLEHVEPTLRGTMLMLSNADALIIDLRINGGGDGRTEELLRSFFYPQPAGLDCRPYLQDMPLYVLTGGGTFSAAEAFVYGLQQTGRAIAVGTSTRGGGHSGASIALADGFLVFMPTGGADSPIEGKPLIPDLPTRETDALLTAHAAALRQLLAASTDSSVQASLSWSLETCEAHLRTYETSGERIATYEGNYANGFRVVSEDGELRMLNEERGIRSALLAINDSCFIASAMKEFGEGNYRVCFHPDGGMTHEVNLGVKRAHLHLARTTRDPEK